MRDFLLKFAVSVGVLLVGFIPLWIYLGVRALANPDGFWQELIFSAVAAYFLIGIQIIALVFIIVALIAIWAD